MTIPVTEAPDAPSLWPGANAMVVCTRPSLQLQIAPPRVLNVLGLVQGVRVGRRQQRGRASPPRKVCSLVGTAAANCTSSLVIKMTVTFVRTVELYAQCVLRGLTPGLRSLTEAPLRSYNGFLRRSRAASQPPSKNKCTQTHSRQCQNPPESNQYSKCR